MVSKDWYFFKASSFSFSLEMSQNVNKVTGRCLRKFKKKKNENWYTYYNNTFYVNSIPLAIVHERERVRERVIKRKFYKKIIDNFGVLFPTRFKFSFSHCRPADFPVNSSQRAWTPGKKKKKMILIINYFNKRKMILINIITWKHNCRGSISCTIEMKARTHYWSDQSKII